MASAGYCELGARRVVFFPRAGEIHDFVTTQGVVARSNGVVNVAGGPIMRVVINDFRGLSSRGGLGSVIAIRQRTEPYTLLS